MKKGETRFWFALPRLILLWRGRNVNRSENNGVEAILAGLLLNLVVYSSAFELCLTSRPLWQQIVFALPLVFVVWIFWVILLYVDALVIRFLRRCGWFRDVPQPRLQSVLIGTVATVFALRLISSADWPKFVGVIWLALLSLNLLATALLSISRANEP